MREQQLNQELIIGVPVGFNNVVESKELISVFRTAYRRARDERAAMLRRRLLMRCCISVHREGF